MFIRRDKEQDGGNERLEVERYGDRERGIRRSDKA